MTDSVNPMNSYEPSSKRGSHHTIDRLQVCEQQCVNLVNLFCRWVSKYDILDGPHSLPPTSIASPNGVHTSLPSKIWPNFTFSGT